jgi:hypothetical protein
MRYALPIVALLLIVVSAYFVGCQNPVETEPAAGTPAPPSDLASVTQVYDGVIPPGICGSEVVATMMTGKNHQSGAIKVANDNEFLYVAFEAEPDYDIITSHLAVARRLKDVPQTPEGEPIPGQFILKRLNNNGTISHTYKIPLVALQIDPALDCDVARLFIFAHAVVKKKSDPTSSEPVWASGKRHVFPGSWATYLFYKIQCCQAPPPPQEITCKPSWAYGSQNFIDARISSDWGWFDIYPVGGTFTQDIIGGAMENDPTKGKVVGVMTVDIARSASLATVTVTLEMVEGFTMNSVGTYFGVTRPWTSDPTQWNYEDGLGGVNTYSTTYQISGAIGTMPFYVAAYTESCGPY